jgi:formate dehydrogenase beta subunit
VDLVIAAVGQHPKKFEGFGVETDKKGRIIVRADSMLTSAQGVCRRRRVLGPSTLIESIAQGRVAAGAMDKLLGGDGDIEEKLLPDGWETDPHIGRDEGFNKIRKFHPIMLDPAKRANWDEVELGFDDATARAEAARCFKCNLAPTIVDAPLPPESWLGLDAATVAGVTTESGVYQLLDKRQEGAGDQGRREPARRPRSHARQGRDRQVFHVEEAPFFSQRENQLVQAYMQQHGSMPPGVGADEMDDLF